MNGNNVDNKKDVPYIVFESELARAERHIKRLWIALITAILVIFATNIVYLWYLNQYDFESYEIVAQGDGHANYIGNDGDIYNGESESAEAYKEES